MMDGNLLVLQKSSYSTPSVNFFVKEENGPWQFLGEGIYAMPLHFEFISSILFLFFTLSDECDFVDDLSSA